MALREALNKILNEYADESTGKFAGNLMADFVRHGLPDVVSGVLHGDGVAEPDVFTIEGSAGQGQWVRCPWVAVFDPVVTESAQRGYYPVYLFREDFTGVYLSLNQGVTDMREQYRSRVKEALRTRAADYRARLGKVDAALSLAVIDLRPSHQSSYAADYEAGNILAAFYSADAMPSEETLVADLRQALELYRQLTYSAGAVSAVGLEVEEQDNNLIEDYAAFRLHRAIERNPSIAKRVKDVRGYVCEACGFTFEAAYPGIEKNRYIEAHHLLPVSQLKGMKVSRNPKTDFVVLCANCHRMIHRHPKPGDLTSFKQAMKFVGCAELQ
jgi:5-methylcytosine-specific restriction protein A